MTIEQVDALVLLSVVARRGDDGTFSTATILAEWMELLSGPERHRILSAVGDTIDTQIATLEQAMDAEVGENGAAH